MAPQETSDSTRTLLRALHFAAEKHQNQRRKGRGRSPYINHPIAVAYTLSEVGLVTDSTTLAAAILHDTLEDTDTEPAAIEDLFGNAVRRLVEEVTDDKELPARQRRKMQIDNISRASVSAKLIRLADKICNLHDLICDPPEQWSLQQLLAYLEWTVRVVNRCRGHNAALDRCYDDILNQGRIALRSSHS
jgi:(p)ppGpp synthase/HD superfamily hydrolase